jgi:hypothetical protein
MKLTGETRISGRGVVCGAETCPSATLSTTNLTRTDPGSNPALCVVKPATNRLIHGTAKSNLEAGWPKGHYECLDESPLLL